ncbi:hypothetical protein FCK90_03090 [Kocuria coralli]|uniref:Uncharacterized protein n=1 Tax=Kocuria coralli TaxID=1461025 RepID=A0A5J5L0B5_9MICC|nr:hypothetical protein [Kocuria coralli]KAA9395399.1 hypothetical protein FCK90_03090 [Kocuria coralli]
MAPLIPLQIGLTVVGLLVVVLGAVVGDALLLLIGGLMTAIAVTGLGMALRARAREDGPRR